MITAEEEEMTGGNDLETERRRIPLEVKDELVESVNLQYLFYHQ